jgi:hypothetical protein
MPSKEEQFWSWFSTNQEALYQATHESVDLYSTLDEQLNKVHSDLTFEFSHNPSNSIKEFCISADGMKEHFPAVIDLVKIAPKLSNWNIRAFRQRITNEEIVISMESIDLSYDDLFFQYSPDHSKISLEIHARNFHNNNDFIGAIFILLDALLGEYDVATQISTIEWKELDEDNIPNLSPFIMLRNVVDKSKALKN